METNDRRIVDSTSCIRVGITEPHGMAIEASRVPPQGVAYTFLKPTSQRHPFFRSPIKGFLRSFDDRDVDIVESVLSPTPTQKPWIYSLACYQEATAFGLLRVPMPLAMRQAYLNQLFRADNFKRLVFWSEAALRTMFEYGRVRDEMIIRKATVVRPAIAEPVIASEPREGRFNLLFSGDFFRKGGHHVVDAFETLLKELPFATLTLCCDFAIDFQTHDSDLKREYIRRIQCNPSIRVGRVTRQEMLEHVLPASDVYLLPTYAEAFGFAVLEAMAYGVPVIATDVFAIPELLPSERFGMLIPAKDLPIREIIQGYVVRAVPKDVHQYLSDAVLARLRRLVSSPPDRISIITAARERALTEFSFERRNREMREIYMEALD